MKIIHEQTLNVSIRKLPFFDSICSLANSFFEKESDDLNKVISPEGRKVMPDDKGFVCIHLPPSTFLEQLDNLCTLKNLNPKNVNFLDVGCGVGQKVFLAQLFGFKSFGLDLRQPFVDRANEILDQFNYNKYSYEKTEEKERVFQANAITFEGYDKFDVIYFYCPIADTALQTELEKQIAQTAKKGAIVLANLANSNHFFSKHNKEEYEKLGWKSLNFPNSYSGIFERINC